MKQERDWNYYKTFLQEYCLGNMPYSNRIPSSGKYYQRKFYSPRDNINKGTGSITIWDPENPQEGKNYTLFTDWSDPSGRKTGDIYALIQLNENLSTRKEAYERCEDLFGPAKKVVMTQAVRNRNRFMKSHKKESRFKRTTEQIELERQQCRAQRKILEEKVIENLKETGCLFKSLRHIPVQIKADGKGNLRAHQLTCANYIHAMVLNEPDPRYMTERDIKKAGWAVKEGAVPVTFEFLNSKEVPYQLYTWKLYNAKDIKGIPAYKERAELSNEAVFDNIVSMLKGNHKLEENEQLFANPVENLNKLSDMASEKTWHDAKILGQSALERELVMTQILQSAGVTTQYKIKDFEPVLRHLERDYDRKKSENLFRSAYRMDVAVKDINDKFTKQLLKETLEQSKELEVQEKIKFKGLSLHMRSDFKQNTEHGFIPRGARLEGESAYKALAAIITEDKKLWNHKRENNFGQQVSFDVTYNDATYPVEMPLGCLHAGNHASVTESLMDAVLKKEKDTVFSMAEREAAITEKVNLALYTAGAASEYAKAYKENPQLCREEAAIQIEKAYKEKEAVISNQFSMLADAENTYLGMHPELKSVKRRADTYLYLIPEDNNRTNAEILKSYESNLIVGMKYASFYGSPEKGTVIETRTPLIPNTDGRFIAPGKEGIAGNLPVQPFLKESERKILQEFEQKFEVSAENETYKGEEARQFLECLMNDDREMFEHQQGGTKPVELSGLQQIQVQYDSKPVIKADTYMGKMEIGNYRSVEELMRSKDENNSYMDDIAKGLHVAEKYSDNPDITEMIAEYQLKSPKEIDENLSQEFLPEGMDAYKPRVGQKASKAMQYYMAKAKVNFCSTLKEKTDYIVSDMARKYKIETVERVISKNLPELKDYVQDSIKRPSVRQIIENKRRMEQEQARCPKGRGR